MKNKKEYMIIFAAVAALLIDILGRKFAVKLVLPVWFDSIGTFLIAYLYGPVCGAFVGFTNNIIYGIFVDQELVYCIVGTLLGIIVGYYSKKKVFDKQFTTMTLGMGLAVFSTVTAVMINAMLYSGKISNVWGNQVMLLCVDKGLPKFISYIDKPCCLSLHSFLLPDTAWQRRNLLILRTYPYRKTAPVHSGYRSHLQHCFPSHPAPLPFLPQSLSLFLHPAIR